MNSSALGRASSVSSRRARQRGRQLRAAAALEQATLRWCISSPIVSPRAIRGLSGDRRPSSRSARPERGPELVAQPAQARQHLGIVAAEAHDLAEALVDARNRRGCRTRGSRPRGAAGSSWSCRSSARPRRNGGWARTRTRRPRRLLRRVVEIRRPSPRTRRRRMTAPRIGPHIRSHSIGGPACSSRRRASSSGTSSPARRTSASTGSAARILWSAARLASSTDEALSLESAARRRWSPPAGGVQSTWTTAAPFAARSRANPARPTLTTRTGPLSRLEMELAMALGSAEFNQ